MKRFIFILTLLFFTRIGFVFAASEGNRDLTVDKALGDLEEGSLIHPPGQYGKGISPNAPGSSLSPAMDTGATLKGSAAGLNNNFGTGSGFSGSTPSGSGGGTNSGEGLDQGGSGGGTGTHIDTGLGGGLDTGPDTSTGGSGGSDHIVDVDLSGGAPTVGVDTGGGSLIGVEGSGGTIAEADGGTTIDSILENGGLVDESVDIGAEIDASGSTTGTETELGVEADVDGSVAGEDVASDPADGISSTSTSLI